MASVADLTVQIKADIADFESNMGRVDTGLNRVSGLAKVAAVGLATAGAAILSLGGQALKSAGDIQALEKGFAATYKGGEDLSVALAKVRDLAKLPGLGLKEALQGATNLQAAGFSADLATRALGAFGNALATVGKGKADLDGVGLALGQIASKGKISAEEINQLAERVPQIRAAMQAAFGTADPQALQKAKISATDFVEGVTAELNKLPKVTGGLNNAFENFSDAVTIALAKTGTALNNAFNIEGLVGIATDALTRLGDAFAALEPSFKAIAAYFGPSGEGGQLFRQLAESAGNAASEIKGAFDALNGAENTGGFVKDLIRDIVVGFTAAADVIGGVIGTITRALKGDFVGAEAQAQRALNALTAPIRNALGLTTQLSGSFDSAFRNIGGGFDGVAGAVGDFGTATAKATPIVAGMSKELEKQLKALRDLDKGYENIGARTALKVPETPDLAVKLPDLAQIPQRLEANLNLGQLIGLEKLSQDAKRLDSIYLGMSEGQREAVQAQSDFNTGMEQLAEQFPIDAFTALGESLGSALSSGADALQSVFNSLLNVVSDYMKKYGKQLLLLGLADAAGGNIAKGTLEIAAGTALIGAGAFVAGSASAAPSSGAGASSSGGGGFASSPRSSFTPTTPPPAAANNTPTVITHNVQFLLQGSTLVGAIAIETDRLGRVRGR